MNNSIKLKRRLTQSLTYLYLIGLSIVIIYPLLITIMSAFKAGNVSAFKLDTNIDLNFDNFKGLFTETLYGTWYLNTLIIALITMAVQTSIIVLAGYAYSRYNFLARKQSLVFFLIIQMVPTMAALTAFFVMALMLNALNHNWFQLLFTSIFLISLSMVPIAIQNSSQETYPLETFIDNVYEPLTNEVVQDLSEHATIVDGTLTYTGTVSQASSVVIGPSQIKELPKNLQLHFDTNELVISKESKELTRISYRAIQTESFKSKDSLTQAISKDWYQQNRVYISLFLVLGASFLFGLNFFIVSLGASLLLYITKKSRLFSFRTFKECYHFILNCLGLPTLITLILGLFGQNMTTLITVQNILFVLYLVTIFYKTHFRDPNYHK